MSRTPFADTSLIAFVTLIASCSTEETFVAPDGGLERMLSQPRYDAFEQSDFFDDGRVMQAPPAGTIPATRAPADPDTERGYHDDGEYLARIPFPLDEALLVRGRDRYDIFCAPCHGIDGHGRSVVGDNMPLVQPRSLHLDRILAYPPGRLYRVINEGYGLMASYHLQLSLAERWAVVAYVRALQLSQNARLAELPEPLQREAREALR